MRTRSLRSLAAWKAGDLISLLVMGLGTRRAAGCAIIDGNCRIPKEKDVKADESLGSNVVNETFHHVGKGSHGLDVRTPGLPRDTTGRVPCLSARGFLQPLLELDELERTRRGRKGLAMDLDGGRSVELVERYVRGFLLGYGFVCGCDGAPKGPPTGTMTAEHRTARQ
jgi:hypothetical protein